MLPQIIDTLLCRNGIVPSISAWVSIVAAFVTLLAYLKIKGVKQELNSYRKSLVFKNRLPAFLEELESVSNFITIFGYGDKEYAQNDLALRIKKTLSVIISICESIKSDDEDRKISIDVLNDLSSKTRNFQGALKDSLRGMTTSRYRKELSELFEPLYQLIDEIKV